METLETSNVTSEFVLLGKATELTGHFGSPVRDNPNVEPFQYYNAHPPESFAPACGEYDI